MFTVDLLKGKGIPVKRGPEGMITAAVALAPPLIITIVMLGFYLHTRIITSIQKNRIVTFENKIQELSDVAEMQKSLEEKKNVINSCLSEVASSLGRYEQWSPILIALVENMPDSMILTKLEATYSSVKRKVPKKDEPGTTVEISVPIRTLQMKVSGTPQLNYDTAVRDFKNRLSSSSLLAPMLEDIRVSQGIDSLQGQDVVSYEIDCIFKPQL